VKEPLDSSDPLYALEHTFFDAVLAVPRRGRYSLALLLDGEEVAQRGLWFGPREAFEP